MFFLFGSLHKSIHRPTSIHVNIANQPGLAFCFIVNTFSCRDVTYKYLQEKTQISFDHLFNERIGYNIFKQFIMNGGSGDPGSEKALLFLEKVSKNKKRSSNFISKFQVLSSNGVSF